MRRLWLANKTPRRRDSQVAVAATPSRLLLREPIGGQFEQLLVDQRQGLVGSVRLATGGGVEDAGDLAVGHGMLSITQLRPGGGDQAGAGSAVGGDTQPCRRRRAPTDRRTAYGCSTRQKS